MVVCDHASNRVPRRLDGLGLGPAALADHIGWDPGAAAVARLLARDLDAPLVLSGYSRLVIDCNRPLASGNSIPDVSADVVVPGNQSAERAEREERAQALFRPYHRGHRRGARRSCRRRTVEPAAQRPQLHAGAGRPPPALARRLRLRPRSTAGAAAAPRHGRPDASCVIGANQPYSRRRCLGLHHAGARRAARAALRAGRDQAGSAAR